MTNKSLDIVVLGATGYTGKFVVKFLANLTKEKYWDVTWGISGRSKQKIDKMLTELNDAGLGLKNIPIMESDVEDEESIKKVLQAAKVVINCTGPHITMSPPIVKACIEAGTHYLDLSAEIYHMLKLTQDYHKAAEDAGVLIIPACGLTALPSETGLIYLQRLFKGTLHTVECHVAILMPKRSYIPGRALLHSGTWTSLVHVLETFKEHEALFRQMYPPLEPEPAEMKRSFFHRFNGRTWFPYPGCESNVAEMSQRYLHEKTQKKPTHYKVYTTLPIHMLIAIPFMFLYYLLSYFGWFRKLLIKYPRIFTLGYASEKGPTEQMRKDTKYYFQFNGKGWDLDADLTTKPTKSMSVKISGRDPGYETTAIAIVMSAITVLKESSNMPKGGVITPGAAFYRTDIVDRLMHDGFTFEVLDSNK
ncbi:unnamed protein product [Chrysodeixis includens]|uniref:Saccharopine dehydrogenase NADP binding domain-containing protein n=1 Tax=Chrysodeixis includens TaxID=689277 RepID=A0A9P0FSN4_CHRIL|nr:unnamed protein product [Chrysodeixis includens]